MSITIVWLPMLESDDESAARRASQMFSDMRVRQFYDPRRLSGLAASNEAFPAGCLHDVLEATPAEHPLHARLKEWAASNAEPPALWDAALFYQPDAEWGDHVPTPARWSKQVGFHGSAAPGEPSGIFLHNSCHAPPVDSDWYVEVRNAMQAMTPSSVAGTERAPRIQLLGIPDCPNTAAIRKNLETALRSMSRETKFEYLNLEVLADSDPRRGWGAPTILINGRDLMGLPPPTSSARSCRVYLDGVPTPDEIARRVQAVNH